MKFVSDIFTEDKRDDKYSSKKTLGIISGILVCLAFIGDGFHWFTVNENLFNSMLIFSATMLGVSTIKAFAKPKNNGERNNVS
jgi:purine-cytosine permease-like protein